MKSYGFVIKTLISFSKVLRSNLNEFEKIGFKKKSIVLITKIRNILKIGMSMKI
jgi:hypothetical protein